MADEVIYIDTEDGIKRVMNNSGLYVKLLVKFKNDNNLKLLEEAFSAGDMEKAQVASHTLKGLSANLSLKELNKYCIETESQIKSKNVSIDQINAIKNVYNQTMTEIDKVIAQYA